MDSNGDRAATDNGDGTWTFTWTDITDETRPENDIQYVYLVDGDKEVIWDNAGSGAAEESVCATRIQNGNMVTDYWSYGNRVWKKTDSLEVDEVYDSCQ